MEAVPMNLGSKVTCGTGSEVTRFPTYRGVVCLEVVEQINLNTRSMRDTDQWT